MAQFACKLRFVLLAFLEGCLSDIREIPSGGLSHRMITFGSCEPWKKVVDFSGKKFYLPTLKQRYGSGIISVKNRHLAIGGPV
jgi:hypothetical protein